MNLIKAKKILLFLGDVALLYLSLYLALALRYREWPTTELWQSHFWPFSIVFAFWLVIFYISGLYNIHLRENEIRFARLALKTLFASALLAAIFFYSGRVAIAPKTNLALFLIIFSIIFVSWRRMADWIFSSRLPKEKIVIIGYNSQVEEIMEEIRKRPYLGYEIAAIFAPELEKEISAQIIKNIEGLENFIKEQAVKKIILAADIDAAPELRNALFTMMKWRLSYSDLASLYEEVANKMPLQAMSKAWFLENFDEGGRAFFNFTKRITDIVLAASLLLITLPLWPFIALIIKLESAGPVFFRQKRVGRDEKIFTMIKWRTMRVTDNDFSPTKNNDERITKFGKIMRATRLDEIPQLLNIFKGDMSLVGPRPERPEIAAELRAAIPFYRERHLVKPGVTGWDQISGEYHSPSLEDTYKKLQYDLFYIKNRSLYLDLSIILKTIATVASRGGK